MKIQHDLIICVPIEEAEVLRTWLLKSKVLDIGRKVRKTTENGKQYLLLPVTEEVPGYTCFSDLMPEIYTPQKSLKELIANEISVQELARIPAGWQVIGTVIIVTIPEDLDHRKMLIGEKLLQMYPRCSCVVRDKGIQGALRLPAREIIAGHGTETIHKENGCLFKLDVTKVMFSKGNLAEKKLMSVVAPDEIVVDMFAGIGYFSIPIAVHSSPKKIISIELNPVSFGYLQENICLNHVESLVEPILGDCAIATPEGVADRVIMGYVGKTHNYLSKGIKALKPEGGILHYHETTPERLVFERPLNRIQKAALQLEKKVEIIQTRRIKKYSPGVWHVVVDAKIM